ncbi:helix-turn-helix transcriptional regulator [Paraburkholderia sediminicola]|uniref:helix-turn-helix transcriptional regulator n=1 Tax=Paraburkholderia sediminicola TaxID=458836 RepID=UPI0038BB4339
MQQYIPGALTLCLKPASLAKPEHASLDKLLPGGLSRFGQIRPFLPVSRETWRLLVLDRRAPQPLRLSSRCTVRRNDEVLAWLANPAAFTVGI